jgi:hypothetical protein
LGSLGFSFSFLDDVVWREQDANEILELEPAVLVLVVLLEQVLEFFLSKTVGVVLLEVLERKVFRGKLIIFYSTSFFGFVQ